MTDAAMPRPDADSGDATGPELALCPVAGIGASAGGLDALRRLMAALRPDTGMAFVVVEHLDPTRESLLAEILSQSTDLPVQQAEHGLVISRGRVYVIPPNVNLGVQDGRLHFTRRSETRAPQHPIDFLFRSLAEQQPGQCAGVVLSGTGADGTLGVCEIKGAGGLTFAQHPDTAQFDGMPRSAINSGFIDFVLSPEEIGARLSTLDQHPYIEHPPGRGPPVPDADILYRRVLSAVHQATDVDFGMYRSATLMRRILRRMAVVGVRSLEDYAALLESTPTEAHRLFRDLLINVTSFFRDPSLFDALVTTVFPRLMEGRTPRMAVRVWVAGCSTGQEAYSLAMVLSEFFDGMPSRPPLQIFATDLAEQSTLDFARAGVYPETIEAEVTPVRLHRFFTRTNGSYQVEKSIRDMCIFARQNVTTDPPFSHIDLISCRNLMIYLESPLQQQLLPTFHYALNPSGFLVLGTSETAREGSDLFELLDRHHKIYVRRDSVRRLPPPWVSGTRRAAGAPPGVAVSTAATPYDLQREADRVLLGRFAPPGVLVNRTFDVLQFRGRTGQFLESPTGEPTRSVLKLAREGLFFELRTALTESSRTGAVVVRDPVPLQLDGEMSRVRIEVIPVSLPQLPQGGFLVLFDTQVDGAERPPAVTGSPEDQAGENSELVHLRREVTSLRDYIQSLMEQQDASTEDLRAANEEILSGNEELQSANEELETAKEELQCANEELVTVNEQLSQRNDELVRSNSDLLNFLSSSGIPLLMVDNDLRLRRITEPARRILDLHLPDAGFPISYLQAVLPVDNLAEQIVHVMGTFETIEREIQDGAGRWYVLRIHPYCTSHANAEGAVLVLLDIDARKRSEEGLRHLDRRKSEFLATAAHELRNPLGPIRQAVDVLQHHPAPPEMQEATAIMDRQVRQLGKLVADLVDITALGHEHIVLRRERLRVRDVLPLVLDSCQPALTEAGVQLVTALPPEPVFLMADRARLAQILINLIDNAAHFSDRGASIALRVQAQPGDPGQSVPGILIEIRDTGAGIPADVLPHVFDLFAQGPHQPAGSHRGFGIGLNLVHRLVTLHGGTVSIESAGQGKGTVVTLRLPGSTSNDAVGEATPGAAENGQPGARRILLVDDNPDQTSTLRMLLTLEGHEVQVAADGRSALERARAFLPDVAILDIGLPDLDGHELARTIRRDPALRDTFLIAQTGWGSAADRAKGVAAGFNVHLVKPVTFEELKGVLRDIPGATPG